MKYNTGLRYITEGRVFALNWLEHWLEHSQDYTWFTETQQKYSLSTDPVANSKEHQLCLTCPPKNRYTQKSKIPYFIGILIGLIFLVETSIFIYIPLILLILSFYYIIKLVIDSADFRYFSPNSFLHEQY